MGRRPTSYDPKKEFYKRIEVDKKTSCWNWKLNVFRFRIQFSYETVVLDPRRYAAYVNGYNIPVGRQVTPGCGNPKCVNPQHTLTKHNRLPISKDIPFLLTFAEMRLGSNAARVNYGRTMEDLREARQNTISVIRLIKREPMKVTYEEIVEKYNVGITFAREARNITLKEFQDLKIDHYDTGETPLDELGGEMMPDAHLF